MSTTTEKIFLDYTQPELDQAYDQMAWAKNGKELHTRNEQRSAEVRTRHQCIVESYGPTEDETLEIVQAGRSGAPVVLYIHGGRWMAQPGDPFIYFAETVVGKGAHFVGARFGTLSATPGEFRLPHMVGQLRRAVVWLYRNAVTFGGDPQQIHLVGHSSGAHLASVLLTTDWRQLGLPASVFKSGTCISGMYDLRPVLLSARSDYVKLNAEEEDELSAMRHLDRVHCPILVNYGDKESPEFQRHALSFSAALEETGHSQTLLPLRDSNHFEGVASLYDAESPLAKAMLKHMGLAAA